MKASELMTEDWVSYNGKYQQVEEINGVYNRAYLTEDEGVDCADIESIPLTPDILLANGFTSIPDLFGFVSADGHITLDPSVPNYPRKWHAHIDNEDFQSIASCDLDYLHQLQHLLTICGIEKEWNL